MGARPARQRRKAHVTRSGRNPTLAASAWAIGRMAAVGATTLARSGALVLSAAESSASLPVPLAIRRVGSLLTYCSCSIGVVSLQLTNSERSEPYLVLWDVDPVHTRHDGRHDGTGEPGLLIRPPRSPVSLSPFSSPRSPTLHSTLAATVTMGDRAHYCPLLPATPLPQWRNTHGQARFSAIQSNPVMMALAGTSIKARKGQLGVFPVFPAFPAP